MDALLAILARLLETMFVIGVAGCVLTIPLVAWKMFSVLIERNGDAREE